MNKKFSILLCGDLDFEEMVADVCYENHTIATLTQENGIDRMEIEIAGLTDHKIISIPLNEFIEVLNLAKKNLIETQKLHEDAGL